MSIQEPGEGQAPSEPYFSKNKKDVSRSQACTTLMFRGDFEAPPVRIRVCNAFESLGLAEKSARRRLRGAWLFKVTRVIILRAASASLHFYV